MESFSKLGQAAFSFSPESAPPELMRQIRSGLFQALAQSWDEFLRSPEFMRSMKETMDQAIAFRKLSTDFLAKARHELGGLGPQDADALVLAISRMESRMVEGLSELSAQLAALKQRLDDLEGDRLGSAPPTGGRARSRSGQSPNRKRGKARTRS
jgi:hypothetical protein